MEGRHTVLHLHGRDGAPEEECLLFQPPGMGLATGTPTPPMQKPMPCKHALACLTSVPQKALQGSADILHVRPEWECNEWNGNGMVCMYAKKQCTQMIPLPASKSYVSHRCVQNTWPFLSKGGKGPLESLECLLEKREDISEPRRLCVMFKACRHVAGEGRAGQGGQVAAKRQCLPGGSRWG